MISNWCLSNYCLSNGSLSGKGYLFKALHSKRDTMIVSRKESHAFHPLGAPREGEASLCERCNQELLMAEQQDLLAELLLKEVCRYCVTVLRYVAIPAPHLGRSAAAGSAH